QIKTAGDLSAVFACFYGKITLAKANRNSSPTYSLVRFAPSHSLRMGDFFRKAVKNGFFSHWGGSFQTYTHLENRHTIPYINLFRCNI
ncbi:hypothetical protein, partial [Heyndrickxia coagulans]|nr:hypothetical protein [Heyndrickxia coagulans]